MSGGIQVTQPTGRVRSSQCAAQNPGRHATQSAAAVSMPPTSARRPAAVRPQSASLPATPPPTVSVVRRARVQAATEAVSPTRPPTRLQAAMTRMFRRCAQLGRLGWTGSLAIFQKLVAQRILRGHRGPDGAPRLRVLDQCSVAPKTRLLLVEVDGQRLLLATAGEQAPTMLFLPQASGARKQRGSAEKSVVREAMPSSPKSQPARSLRSERLGRTAPTSASVESSRWPVQPALGSEIQ